MQIKRSAQFATQIPVVLVVLVPLVSISDIAGVLNIGSVARLPGLTSGFFSLPVINKFKAAKPAGEVIIPFGITFRFLN